MKIVLAAILFVAALGYFAANTLKSPEFSGITIHLAGDSTLAVQLASKRPLTGWGEPLTAMLCEGVRVVNHAKNGRSSKSFLAEGLWKDLLAQLRTGDVVNIQFGHNDQKESDPELYAQAWQGYRDNLQRFVLDVRSRGAIPVLLTSIARRAFDSQGKLQNTLGDYPAVTRLVAEALDVKLIDLNASTSKLVEDLGYTDSKTLFLHLAPNLHKNYPEGEQDNTHLNSHGALKVAKLAANGLKEMQAELVCL